MRGSHCVPILQVVNSKRPSLSRCSQDTVRAKTNRHLDKIKGGTGGLEDIETATNDLLQVSSLLPVSLALCVSFSCRLPLFPLTHPLMVIYLAGKGFAFSPERSTTGRGQKPSSLGKKGEKKKEHEEERERDEEGKNRREKNEKYIIHVGLPGDTDSPSHSPSQL